MKERNLSPILMLVEQSFGRRVSTSTDCGHLSNEIFDRTEQRLNVSTLRRAFGLIKSDYPPSLTTLHILSRYCGFSSYDELMKEHDRQSEAAPKDNKSLLRFLVSIFTEINTIEAHDATFADIVRNTIYFIKENPDTAIALQKEIAKTPNGQRFYFEHNVYIDKLNGFYGKGLQYYLREKKTDEAQIFGNALLAFYALLTDNTETLQRHYKQVMGHTLHKDITLPTRARHFATRIFFAHSQELSSDHILNEATELAERLRTEISSPLPLMKFHLIMAEALVLTGHFEEALSYSSVYKTPVNGASAHEQCIVNAIALFHSVSLLQAGQQESSRELFARIDPNKFGLLSRKYHSILYLLLAARINKTKVQQEQLEFLIKETGFSMLQRYVERFFNRDLYLRIA